MDKKAAQLCRRRAKVIKALAHPSRLFIVDVLSGGEACVNELRDMIGCDMSTVSRHLGVLKNAGIVRDEKRGVCIYYSLRCQCIMSFFKCADTVFRSARDEQFVIA